MCAYHLALIIGYWTQILIIFSMCNTRQIPLSNFEIYYGYILHRCNITMSYTWGENGERDFNKTKICRLFLQRTLLILKVPQIRTQKSRPDSPLSCFMFYVGCDRNSERKKLRLRFQKQGSLFLNGEKTKSPEDRPQVLPNFCAKTVTYLECNFKFTNLNYFCI